MLSDLAILISTTLYMQKWFGNYIFQKHKPPIVEYQNRSFAFVFEWMLCKFSSMPQSLNKLFFSNTLIFVRLRNRHICICLAIYLVEAGQLSFIVFTKIHLNWVAALTTNEPEKKNTNNDRPLEIICCLLGKLFNAKTYYL